MRKPLSVLLCLLLLLGPAVAEDEPKKEPPKPLTVEQAADAVLTAVKAKDDVALKALAEKDNPDPWLVADELCYRGKHDVAETLAKAAPRKAVDGLPAYVSTQRGTPYDSTRRVRLAAVGSAVERGKFKVAVELLGPPPTDPIRSVVGVRLALFRGFALRGLRQHRKGAMSFRAAGNAALRFRWLAVAQHALGDAGFGFYYSSDWRSAASAWHAQLEIARALGDRVAVLGTLVNIGVTEFNRGDYVKALSFHERAYELAVDIGHGNWAATALANIGNVHAKSGRLAKALEAYERALAAQRAHGNRAGAALTLTSICNIYEGRGEYAKAIQTYERAFAVLEALGNKAAAATTLMSIGNIHVRLGEYAKALQVYEKSFAVLEALGRKAAAATSLANIGIVKARLGQHAQALEAFNRALAIQQGLGAKADAASTLSAIGSTHSSLGDYAKALRTFEQALGAQEALSDEFGAATTLGQIGVAYHALGDDARALEVYGRARRLLEECGAAQDEAIMAWRIASIHLASDRPEMAVGFAREGVALVCGLYEGLSEGRGAGARDLFSGLFDTGYRAALRAGLPGDLFWFLEQGRAGSLRESLGLRSALEGTIIPPDLRTALQSARLAERRALDAYRSAGRTGRRKAVRSARREWEDARTGATEVSARIQREAKAAAALTLAATDDLEAVKGHLRFGEALVLFGMTSEEAFALVVREDDARIAALPVSASIEEEVDAFLDHDMGVDVERRAGLRKLLVEPLQLSKDVTRVLVAPDGRLGYVPIALLFPGREVACVPSGTTYGLLLEERAKQGSKILGLGDPDYQTKVDEIALKIRAGNVTKLPRLPATKKEVEAIADVHFLDKRATETGLQDAVKAQERWRAVHFACHGLVDPERPMLSALALTADKENDGFLTALEIFRMKIPADLVVMSACETGKGKIYKTEGIVGLTRAFMFAGAPRVICSLWKVDDEATKALMIKFYELWNPKDGSKGLGAAAALKKAQEYIRTHPDHPKWKHPYYWAAWVLWGLPD